MKTMTMKERMLALIQGKPHDRVPMVQYNNTAGPDAEVLALLGLEQIGILQWVWVYIQETPNCRWDSEVSDQGDRRMLTTILHTPEGDLTEKRFIEPVFGSSAAASHYVQEPDDYKKLLAFFRDIRITPNVEGVRAVIEGLGDTGLPHASVMRSPFQQLWVQWVGMEDLACHLAMEPDLMEEVFAALEGVQRQVFQAALTVARETSIPYIDVPDNITAPMIGVDYFRRHCVTAYNELACVLEDAGRDTPIFVHMDGDLKPLWEAIGESRVKGLDSMSPPPDNDTSVAQALSLWPEMRVCINFPSSVHLRPPREVYKATMRILEEGGHSGRLQIQFSENVPPGVWRENLPAIAEAIRDFGDI